MTAAQVIGEPGDLSPADFTRVATLIQRVSGIYLAPGKESLVRARLASRIRALGIASYRAYIEVLARDPSGTEMESAIDLLTTNKTSFFREPRHFTFLDERLRANKRQQLRIWCAASSTGEEPYSIAMSVAAAGAIAPYCDTKILATDICRNVLATAETGVYPNALTTDIPPALASRYLEQGPSAGTVRVKSSAKDLVTFARLNLMERWPMKGKFDFIFCRNVMMYFDHPTRQALVERMRTCLVPGGFLLIGHAESLSSLQHRYTYHQPAVYKR